MVCPVLLRAVCPLCSVVGVLLHEGRRTRSLHLLRAVCPLCSVVGMSLHEEEEGAVSAPHGALLLGGARSGGGRPKPSPQLSCNLLY